MDEPSESRRRLGTTARIMAPIVAELRKLPDDQVEELVLFLKNIHNPPSDYEQDVDASRAFDEKLRALRKTTSQNKLRLSAKRARLFSSMSTIGAGMLATLGAVFWKATGDWTPSAALLIPTVLLLVTSAKWNKKIVLLSFEEERQYLWASLRIATSLTELSRVGLLDYCDSDAPLARSAEAAKAVKLKVIKDLRNAIYRHIGESQLQGYWGEETESQRG
jgi:hypothetical protein